MPQTKRFDAPHFGVPRVGTCDGRCIAPGAAARNPTYVALTLRRTASYSYSIPTTHAALCHAAIAHRSICVQTRMRKRLLLGVSRGSEESLVARTPYKNNDSSMMTCRDHACPPTKTVENTTICTIRYTMTLDEYERCELMHLEHELVMLARPFGTTSHGTFACHG